MGASRPFLIKGICDHGKTQRWKHSRATQTPRLFAADHDAACAQEQADKARKVAATDAPPHTPGTPEPPAANDADPLGINRLADARTAEAQSKRVCASGKANRRSSDALHSNRDTPRARRAEPPHASGNEGSANVATKPLK